MGSPFETKTRDSGGGTFVTLRDDAPEWLQDTIREAHFGAFPNDWIYAECEAAFDAYQDQGERPDTHEHADGRVDVYTKDLYHWAEDMCLTDLFSEAEERATEFGPPNNSSVLGVLRVVQYCAIEMIAAVMFDAIEANKEDEP